MRQERFGGRALGSQGTMELLVDERRRRVLTAVLVEYIQTGEPVGSRAVARRHHMGLSPATIRNTMADLEEMGYLSQPHTSAGRIPTDSGYRFYVDNLADDLSLGSEEVTELRRRYHTRGGSAVEQLMERTSFHLSALSRMTGVLLAPPLNGAVLSRVDLIPLSNDRVLAMVVTESGWITTRALSVESRIAADDLREVGRQLTRRLRGKTFHEIVEDLSAPIDPLDPLRARAGALVDQIFSLLRDRTLYVGGAINILDHPEFWDIETMRNLLRAFEEKDRLIDLLSRQAEERGVQVMIGHENPYEEMQECSFVTSTYIYRDQALGILGVVGPKRMPYSKVITLVQETARLVSQALSQQRQELYLPS